jgi:hypothetical protein
MNVTVILYSTNLKDCFHMISDFFINHLPPAIIIIILLPLFRFFLKIHEDSGPVLAMPGQICWFVHI